MLIIFKLHFFPAGIAVLSECPSGRGYVWYTGEKAISSNYCLIHMCTHTTDENQSHVGLFCFWLSCMDFIIFLKINYLSQYPNNIEFIEFIINLIHCTCIMYILNKFSSRKYLNLLSTCSRILKKGSCFHIAGGILPCFLYRVYLLSPLA